MPERRRLITILFADVTGSTALGESLDPEDVRVLMGRYFAHLRPCAPGGEQPRWHAGEIHWRRGDGCRRADLRMGSHRRVGASAARAR